MHVWMVEFAATPDSQQPRTLDAPSTWRASEPRCWCDIKDALSVDEDESYMKHESVENYTYMITYGLMLGLHKKKLFTGRSRTSPNLPSSCTQKT